MDRLLDFFKLKYALRKEHPVILWLDDERDPMDTHPSYMGEPTKFTWVESVVGMRNPGNWDVQWVRNYKQFTNFIECSPTPDIICFDHDLGEQMNGKDCANYLVDVLMERNLLGPVVRSQSSNPSGASNILGLLDNWHDEWQRRNPDVDPRNEK